MNNDYESIKSILTNLRLDYISDYEKVNPRIPITERDIVAEIYGRLRDFCHNKNLFVHCEIKPARSENATTEELKKLPRIDVGILTNLGSRAWIDSAIRLQNKYNKGLIEARFSSIPIEYFHTAIEVKIQSNISDVRKDIELLKWLQDSNNSCNCLFVLLNARGKRSDHDIILRYANGKGICVIEYSCR